MNVATMPMPTRPTPWNGPPKLARDLQGFARRVNAQEDQQARRDRHQEHDPARPEPPQRGQPEHAEKDRDDADVQADEREAQQRAASIRVFVSAATGISVLNGIEFDEKSVIW